MIPVIIIDEVGTYRYKSISAAWRGESPKGLPEVTVRKRLKAGWPALLAFHTPAVIAEDRRSYKEIRELVDRGNLPNDVLYGVGALLS